MTLFATQFALFAGLSLRGWFPVWLAFLVGIAGMAWVGFLYVNEAGRLRFGTRTGLALIRMMTIAVVAFLLLRPVWTTESKGEKRRTVAVLVDVSQSMNRDDPRPNPQDVWQVAVAYNYVEPTEKLTTTALEKIAVSSFPARPKRIDVAKAALENPKLNLFARLKTVGPLDPAVFGSQRAGKPADKFDWVADLTGKDPQTALAGAAFELLGRDENELPAAIVLVTDGRDNASDKSLDDLAAECRRLDVKLYVYGVGSSAFGQLQLRDLAVPSTIFVGDTAAVGVRYRLKGVSGGKVKIDLKLGDKLVASKTVPAENGDNLREVLGFVPPKQGKDAEGKEVVSKKLDLTATVTYIPPAAGDADPNVTLTTEGLTDELGKAVDVIDKKLRVLVIDSFPRWDFKFLQRALLRDKRVDAKFFLTEADPEAMKPAIRQDDPNFEEKRKRFPWLPELLPVKETGVLKLPKDEFRTLLFDYDLLILGDVPARYFPEEHQKVIQKFVEEGGGLIHLAGRTHAPAGWAGPDKSLGTILPVEFNAVRYPIISDERPKPFRPQVATGALRHPLLSLDDDPIDNAKAWQTLPEIHWYYPVTRLKPAAEVFLTHPTEKTPAPDNKAMPLVAGHYYGSGYVLFIGFDETYRWRFNEADRYFGRFWSQAVYLTGVTKTLGTKLTQLSLDTPDPTVGKVGQVYARLFTDKFEPVKRDAIDATLIKIDAGPNDKEPAVRVTLHAIRGPDDEPTGEYVATVPFNRTGKFALKVDANNGQPAELGYRVVLPPEHEMAPGGMAEAELRKLAEGTGGQFYREEDLHHLPDDVKPKSVAFVKRTETLLWNWWTFGLVIGLLTLEWCARKWNSLS